MRSPEVEAQALNETEKAIREIVQVGLNIGASKASLAFMLNRISAELMPEIALAEPHTVQ